MQWMLLVQWRRAGRLRRTRTGAAQAGKYILCGVVCGGQWPRAMEIGIARTHRGRAIVVELISGMSGTAHIVQLCCGMLIAGIIMTAAARASMQRAHWSRRRWRQWWTRLLLLHAGQQHTLAIGVVINGIQWYVLAIAMIIVTVALAQTAQLATGYIVAVVHNVIVQRLQIGCGQSAFLLLLAMK